ncbi:MAG: 30S ribosomal protein S16 [Candidatus Berkiellales bacterium]
MVVIRLARSGAKKRPFYSIVVADQRYKRDGRFIERIGFYNPMAEGKANEESIRLNRLRIDHWVKLGAQLSTRVATLVKQFDENPSATLQAG